MLMLNIKKYHSNTNKNIPERSEVHGISASKSRQCDTTCTGIWIWSLLSKGTVKKRGGNCSLILCFIECISLQFYVQTFILAMITMVTKHLERNCSNAKCLLVLNIMLITLKKEQCNRSTIIVVYFVLKLRLQYCEFQKWDYLIKTGFSKELISIG